MAGLVFLAGGFGLQFALGRVFPDAMAQFAEGVEGGRQALIITVAIRLAIGFVTVWLYAAARFRLRSKTRTAVRVGLAAWFLLYVPQLWILESLGALPRAALGAIAAWGVAETIAAAWAGGVVHQLTRPDAARY